jgi:Protein of unknown function (DUF3800)
MEFSDYIIYVDESGDHSLDSIDPQYPIFALAFCIFKKDEYAATVVPALQRFKFKWFGHDLVILHENEIVRAKYPFSFLQYDDTRSRFMGEIAAIIGEAPMTVVAAVIRKQPLRDRYIRPDNPYQLALLFCLERARDFLAAHGACDKVTYMVCEARSPRQKGGMGREDQELELEFRRIIQGRHMLQQGQDNAAMPNFEIVFAPKQCNSTGMQLADLIARPIGLKALRPDQVNRAYDVIAPKIWAGGDGRSPLQGFKVFP